MKKKQQLVATQTTNKKVKYVGTERYINSRTGEIEEFQVTNIEERDFDFAKVWMRNFILTLDLVGNQKTKLAMWIIDHLNKENQLLGTMREMSELNHMSLETVRTTMKLLQEADFLRKIRSGTYVVNPNVVFKGTRTARLNILHQYQELGYEPPKLTEEQKIKQLQNSIEELQKELDKLQKPKTIDAEIDGQMEILPDGTFAERATDRSKKQ